MTIELTENEERFNAGIRQEVYASDCYRLRGHTFDTDVPVIVDLGANFGWFSRLAAEEFPTAKIFGYEMIERNYQIARQVTLAGISNVSLNHGIAIGHHQADIVRSANRDERSNLGGNRVIVKDSDFYLNNVIDPSQDKFQQTDSSGITQVTIADIIEHNKLDHIDYLKIDIEGSEYDVLEYVFDNNLSHKISYAALEVHGIHLPGEDGYSKQYLWLKEQCEKHFEKVHFAGSYAWLSNPREKNND